MTCAELNEQLVDYLYEELPPSQRQALEAHLAGCEGCRSEVTTLGRTLGRARQALRGPLAETPPVRVHAAVLEAARQAVSPASPASSAPAASRSAGGGAALWAWIKRPWFLPAFAAASAMAIFLLARPALITPEPTFLSRDSDRRALEPPRSEPPPAISPGEESAARTPMPASEREAAPVVAADQPERGSAARPAVRPRPKAVADDPLGGLSFKDQRRSPPSRKPAAARPARSWAQPPVAGGAGIVAEAPAATAPSYPAERAAPETEEADEGVEAGLASAQVASGRGAETEMAAASRRSAAPTERKGRVGAPTGASAGVSAAAAPRSPAVRAEASAPAANFAQPPPPAVAAAASPAPSPAAPPPAAAAPTTLLKKRKAVADAPESSVDALSDTAAGARQPLPLAELRQRADRALREGRHVQAAADYRELLRRFPDHRDVPAWRRQLAAATEAINRR